MSRELEMNPENHHVAVLGAHTKSERYSNQAVRLLMEHGYRVTPIHPKFKEIEGLPVTAAVEAITDQVDTLTLYIGPERLQPMIGNILKLNPKRVICNPGTESRELQDQLDAAGIPWLEGCTLVMLRTGVFLD